VCDGAEVEEQTPWRELPAAWSVPKPGKRCHMSRLLPSDPEYMEVEHHARKVVMKPPVRILSVSKTCAASVRCLCSGKDQVRLVTQVSSCYISQRSPSFTVILSVWLCFVNT